MIRSHRRPAAVILLALSVVIISACSPSSTSTTGSSPASGPGSPSTAGGRGGGASVAAIIKGLDNPFFQAMEQGIQDQASAQGSSVTVQAATSITDTTGQADKLNSLAQQNFSCFLVNPISGTNLVQSLVEVQKKNKPIVNIDSPVDPKAQTSGSS